ncbi:MAG: MBL fold metallo-hydrolase [Anaerolineaceae bacterium]|nr:MBL fold metallo-hydrolase [Anaerolineaceae bacterium]MBQ6344118.1 MBL fold metallo-hydrolase [Anaerolineaceae bacterium]
MISKVPVEGYFTENCYFFIDERTKHGFIIDPGAQADLLLDVIQQNGWAIEKILLTHGHFDHTGAVNELRSALGISVLAHKKSDAYLLNARNNLSALCGPAIIVRNAEIIDDGDVIRLDGNPEVSLQVIYTPGHTTDSVVYYAKSDHAAFVGDTIFKGSIGNYSYPGAILQLFKTASSGKYLHFRIKRSFFQAILNKPQLKQKRDGIILCDTVFGVFDTAKTTVTNSNLSGSCKITIYSCSRASPARDWHAILSSVLIGVCR